MFLLIIFSRKERYIMNNYDYQQKANIACLLEDMEYSERKEGLLKIVSEFAKEGVRWGLACSMNLFIRGLVDEFHDLDLIVDAEDIPKIEEIMQKNGGILVGTGGNGYCESDIYLHYQLGRIDVDIISGFRVITFGTNFLYNFNAEEIEFMEIDSMQIPLISMEALYLLYAMMEGWQPKRRYKRILIEEYLLNNELKFIHILETALEDNLPACIKHNIRELIKK